MCGYRKRPRRALVGFRSGSGALPERHLGVTHSSQSLFGLAGPWSEEEEKLLLEAVTRSLKGAKTDLNDRRAVRPSPT
eukprot:5030411-Pyramimonas_sp.AAC.1